MRPRYVRLTLRLLTMCWVAFCCRSKVNWAEPAKCSSRSSCWTCGRDSTSCRVPRSTARQLARLICRSRWTIGWRGCSRQRRRDTYTVSTRLFLARWYFICVVGCSPRNLPTILSNSTRSDPNDLMLLSMLSSTIGIPIKSCLLYCTDSPASALSLN